MIPLDANGEFVARMEDVFLLPHHSPQHPNTPGRLWMRSGCCSATPATLSAVPVNHSGLRAASDGKNRRLRRASCRPAPSRSTPQASADPDLWATEVDVGRPSTTGCAAGRAGHGQTSTPTPSDRSTAAPSNPRKARAPASPWRSFTTHPSMAPGSTSPKIRFLDPGNASQLLLDDLDLLNTDVLGRRPPKRPTSDKSTGKSRQRSPASNSGTCTRSINDALLARRRRRTHLVEVEMQYRPEAPEGTPQRRSRATECPTPPRVAHGDGSEDGPGCSGGMTAQEGPPATVECRTFDIGFDRRQRFMQPVRSSPPARGADHRPRPLGCRGQFYRQRGVFRVGLVTIRSLPCAPAPSQESL